jgi:hypothetical protein
LRYTLPITAIAAMLGIVFAPSDTPEEAPEAGPTTPVTLFQPPPRIVEVSAPPLPSEVPMLWSVQEFHHAQVVGIAGSRPTAMARVGNGMPAFINLASGKIEVYDGLDLSNGPLFALFLESDDELLIIGQDRNGTHIWREQWESAEERSYEVEPQVGLLNVGEITAAAGNRTTKLVLGLDDRARPSVWVSTVDRTWIRAFPQGLNGARPELLLGVEDGFVLAGRDCRNNGCVPAIWLSGDGIEWHAAEGLGRVPGTVTGMVQSENSLYAVGTLDPGLGAFWQSVDGGLTWQTGTGAGLGESVDVTVESIDTDTTPPTARLAVDDEPVLVREGGTLLTPLGDIQIRALGDLAVLAAEGYSPRAMPIGATWTLRSAVHIGSRSLAGESPRPMAWIRAVHEPDWHPSPLPVPFDPEFVFATTIRLGVVGTDGENAIVLSGTWDLKAEETAAIAAVELLLDALTSADIFLAWEMLAPRLEATPPLSVPGLGGFPIDVWYESGNVDPVALSDVIDYLTALDASVTLEECDASPSFVEVERVRVACDYVATSSLLRRLGLGETEGTLIARTRMGQVSSIWIAARGEQEVWNRFAWFGSALYPRLPQAGPTASWLDSRNLTAETAVQHLEAAGAMDRYSLTPGETRVVDSPFGTLEVSSIIDPFDGGDKRLNGLAWHEGSYVAATSGYSDGEFSTQLWESRDGLDWVEKAMPQSATSVDDLDSMGENLIAWESYRQTLWIRRAGTWQEHQLPMADELDAWISDSASSGNTGIFIVRTWNDTSFDSSEFAFIVAADGTVRQAELPVHEDARDARVVGYPGGFLLFTSTEDETQLWTSQTGGSWSLLAGLPRTSTGWPIDLAWTGERFLLFSQSDEEFDCTLAEFECVPSFLIWASPDGRTWDKLATAPGPVDLYGAAVGDLGIVASGRGGAPFQLIWLSADGTGWAVPEGLLVDGAPRDSRAAVGEAGFVVGVSTAERDASRLTLVVARVVAD